MKKITGVIGLGDLGRQLAVQIKSAGFDVIAFDIDKTKTSDCNIRIAESQLEVLEQCSIVHWAIPSTALNALSNNLGDAIVILHDSVMNSSLLAIRGRNDSNKFAIAHCLMNEARRVFVAGVGPHSSTTLQHFQSIGSSPKLTTIKDHDVLMAHSQGLLAALVKSGLRQELEKALYEGSLTPSGVELCHLLINRELNWTPHTLDSILCNPELKEVTKAVTCFALEL